MLSIQKVNPKNHLLRRKEVFQSFTDEEFYLLSTSMHFRTYKKGQVLFDEGDQRNKVFYLSKGLVKLERYDSCALYMYTDYIKENKLFPYGDLFSNPTYRYTAYCLTDVEMYCIPTEVFESVLAANPHQMLHFYKSLSSILKEHEERIQFLVGSNASSRIVKALSFLMNDLGISVGDNKIKVPYPITICEIATISGCSRETVGIKLKQLKQIGKIEYSHKVLTFNDVLYFKNYWEE
ncbi:Crp/Fnr family transcriptional regulator [Desemzia incerta]|uniref:Crp/Fnr family transcriptional regulator n=1 Tax=Desemzia incerta TaxID=82801 RepID=UPI003315EDA2